MDTWDITSKNEELVSDQRLGWRIASSFRPYVYQICLVGGLILLSAGFGVVNPLLIRVVFDYALFPMSGIPDLQLLWMIAGVMSGVIVVTSFIGIAQTYFTNTVGQKVMRDLRNRLFNHLQSLSLGFFTDTRTGEIQSRVSDDVGGVQNVVTSTVTDIISNVVILISTVVAMAILSIELTVVAVAIVPIFAVITKKIGERRRMASRAVQKSTADMTAITQETLSVSGVMLTKLFGRQSREAKRFTSESQNLSDLIIRREMTGQSVWAIMQAFFSISPIMIYVLAGYMLTGVGDKDISAGVIVAFTTLQSRLYFPIVTLLRVSVNLQSSLALFERIFGYLDLESDIVDSDAAIVLSPRQVLGRVQFQSVSMRYEASRYSNNKEVENIAETWALEDVSFDIQPGQLVALVGPSGAGKTTISYLLTRLYDPTKGFISIDGYDLKDIKLKSISEIIGYVSQESYLFHATIKDNLLYGRPDADEQDVYEAARAANIHQRIMEFPEQYNTVVGERGYRLSGGERQRLAIGRVILHQPRILVLDEATSALDTGSERLIQQALQPLMKGRTTIAIAHRLSTILAADVIYFIDHGRIIESGSHSDLVSRKGFYYELYQQQFMEPQRHP